MVVRYVIENPVRKGLVTEARHYPFTGSAVYSLDALVEYAYGAVGNRWAG